MLITLTTDFGLRDHYVAAMKGVIACVAPQVRVVDVSHEVPAFDWRAAAYVLGACYNDFPDGTVHVVVVDPGVGSKRLLLAIQTERGWFVGPDNGCLDDAVRGAGIIQAWRIKTAMRRASATFHGRDLFAPVAAKLAAGHDVREWIERVKWQPKAEALTARRTATGWAGHVVWVDRFGNLVTTVKREEFGAARRIAGTVGKARVEGFHLTYAEATGDQPFWIWGSGGRLEISVREGSAAAVLGVTTGCSVEVSGR